MTRLEIKRTNAIFDVLWEWRLKQVDALPAFVKGMAEGYAPTKQQVVNIAKNCVKAEDAALKGTKP